MKNPQTEEAPLVLVIDDDTDYLEATRIVLENAGYSVTMAMTGEQGFESAIASGPVENSPRRSLPTSSSSMWHCPTATVFRSVAN